MLPGNVSTPQEDAPGTTEDSAMDGAETGTPANDRYAGLLWVDSTSHLLCFEILPPELKIRLWVWLARLKF